DSRLLLRVFELGESTLITFVTAVLFLLLSAGITSAAPEAICSDPNVLFCDNFEDRDVGNGDFSTNKGGKTLGWGVGDASTQSIVSGSQCQDGGKCLQQVYPDLSTPQKKDNGGGGFLGTATWPQERTLYYRTWFKYPSNWVAGVPGSGS